MKLYGIWCKDHDGRKGGYRSGDWLREVTETAILAFESKRAACQYAAAEYSSFKSYTEAKRKGWVEVKKLRWG